MTNIHDGHVYLDVSRQDGHHDELLVPDPKVAQRVTKILDLTRHCGLTLREAVEAVFHLEEIGVAS